MRSLISVFILLCSTHQRVVAQNNSCLRPRTSPGPGCQSNDQLLCVRGWPEQSEGWRQVNVTVLLPDNFYSNKEKRCIPESETQLQANYKRVGPAIMAGFNEAHERGWLPNITFNIEFRDTFCSNIYAPKVFSDLLLTGNPVNVIFGPACDYALAAVARFSKFHSLPLVTAGGFAMDFSEPKDKKFDEFYMLTRTGMAWTGLVEMFHKFMIQEKWSKYTLVYRGIDHREWSGDHSCYQLASAMSHKTIEETQFVREVINLDNMEKAYYNPDQSDNIREYSLKQNMTMLQENLPGKNSSIILICASPKRTRNLILAAKRLGMLDSGQYVFFNMENVQNLDNFQPWVDEEALKSENLEAKEAFQSVLTLNLGSPHGNVDTSLTEKVKEVARNKFDYEYKEDISNLAKNFFDAALVYSKALNMALEKNGAGMLSNLGDYGEEISGNMMRMNISGASGAVRMNSNRDKQTSYAIMALKEDAAKYSVAYTFSPRESTVVKGLVATNCSKELREVNDSRCWSKELKEEDTLDLVPGEKIVWPGKCDNEVYRAMQLKSYDECVEGLRPPKDFPVCGFLGEACIEKDKDHVGLIVSVVLAIILICVIVIGLFVFRKYKEEAEIARMNWKIDPSEIMTSRMERGRFGSKISLMTRASLDSLGCEDGRRQEFVKTAYYNGQKMALKLINIENINLNRALLLELKQMKDLHHDHLTRWVGACLQEGFSFMITEYCPRGSLQDILEDSDFELDTDFRISLINDIVRGMAFLHASEIRYHGNLKSSNCVVDSRFVLKLTDFGLHSLRRSECDAYSHQYYRSKLWTAPELLRADQNLFSPGPPKKVSVSRMESSLTRSLLQKSNPVLGSAKGDVYSFGIIVHEIVVRLGTWGSDVDFRAPEEILTEVINSGSRPQVDDSVIEPTLVSIMRRSWAEQPHERIDFTTIKHEMRKVNRDTRNILDNLLSRMERYADNLETAVKERTQDYLEEKKKCEDLLYELLPKSVASRLIQGQHVMAETFQSVTIYFSDIVGFTALSSSSTALEVVELLNDLYTLFDNIITQFDVYKVETIGDAYMVVSGLPLRNGQNHAREISRMSLQILEAVKTFKIRHKPEEQLKIRIGLHTGSCCAGVVGIKMPRYCLFGDTVNTSSRMESNGLPLKIHISEATRNALLVWGTFVLELRGEVDMKGKGVMKTYWLLGENSSSLAPTDSDIYFSNSVPIDSNANLAFTDMPLNQTKLNSPEQMSPQLQTLPRFCDQTA